MKALAPAMICAVLAAPAAAQSVTEDCADWRASARNVPDPVGESVLYYAGGAIRVTLLDTVEPAAGAFYLMVQTPPYGELGDRRCVLVGADPGTGFAGLDFARADAVYDPSAGLTVRMPATLFAPATGGFDPAILAVTVNQATGTVVPRYESP